LWSGLGNQIERSLSMTGFLMGKMASLPARLEHPLDTPALQVVVGGVHIPDILYFIDHLEDFQDNKHYQEAYKYGIASEEQWKHVNRSRISLIIWFKHVAKSCQLYWGLCGLFVATGLTVKWLSKRVT
jgi:hypothetical protein